MEFKRLEIAGTPPSPRLQHQISRARTRTHTHTHTHIHTGCPPPLYNLLHHLIHDLQLLYLGLCCCRTWHIAFRVTYNGHDAVFIHGGYNGDEVRLCPALACCVGFSQQGVLVLCWRDTTTNALARCVALIGVQAMNDAFVLDLVERKWLKISDAYMSTPCAGMAVLCSQQFSLAGAGAGGVQTQIQTRTQHFRPPPPPPLHSQVML